MSLGFTEHLRKFNTIFILNFISTQGIIATIQQIEHIVKSAKYKNITRAPYKWQLLKNYQ